MTLPKTFRTDRLTKWHVLAALVMGALGVMATFDAWHDIYTLASKDEEYSHIILVPFVVLGMLWFRRMRMRHCKPSGAFLGVLLVALGWVMFDYGFYNARQALWHLGAVVVTLGCMLSVLGKNVVFRFFPAIAVLIFLVPVPGKIRQQIAIPLQTWTAQVAQTGLEICNVETDISGNTLYINGQPVSVVEGCNGMRMIFPLLLVTYTFCFALPLRNVARILILLASPLVAIICNVIRTLPTVWLFGKYGQKHSIPNTFHEYAGWAMTIVAFLVLLGIIKVLKWAMLPLTRFPLASQYA